MGQNAKQERYCIPTPLQVQPQVCAALDAQWGILAAGAGALVFAARQYRYVGKICEKDNRGEAL